MKPVLFGALLLSIQSFAAATTCGELKYAYQNSTCCNAGASGAEPLADAFADIEPSIASALTIRFAQDAINTCEDLKTAYTNFECCDAPPDKVIVDDAPKPHILFVLADDLGRSAVGPFAKMDGTGSFESARSEFVTPNLDAAAAEGLLLNRHYSYMACTPSRASLMTGRLPVHVGIILGEANTWDGGVNTTWGWEGMPPNVTTMAKKLQGAGYATHMVGKFDGFGIITHEHVPRGRGFNSSMGYVAHGTDYYLYTDSVQATGPPNPICQEPPWNATDAIDFTDGLQPAYWALEKRPTYREDLYEQRALDIIASHDPAVPLFLFYAAGLVHTPLQVDYEPFHEMATEMCDFNPQCLNSAGDCPATAQRDLCGKCPEGETCWWTTCPGCTVGCPGVSSTLTCFECPGLELPPNNGTCALEERISYLAMLKVLDKQIGTIFNAVKSKGMWERTLVVFAADNGGGVGIGVGGNNYPLKGGKGGDWDGGFRTAALVTGGFLPANVRNTVSNVVLHLCDWYVTFAHLAGANASDPTLYVADVDGVDVWDSLAYGAPEPRSVLHLSPKALLQKDTSTGEWWKLLSLDIGNTLITNPDFPSTDCADPSGNFGCRPLNPAPFGPLPLQYDCGDLDKGHGCLFNLFQDDGEQDNKNLTESARLASMTALLVSLNEDYLEPFRGCGQTEVYCNTATYHYGAVDDVFNPTGHPYYGSFVNVNGCDTCVATTAEYFANPTVIQTTHSCNCHTNERDCVFDGLLATISRNLTGRSDCMWEANASLQCVPRPDGLFTPKNGAHLGNTLLRFAYKYKDTMPEIYSLRPGDQIGSIFNSLRPGDQIGSIFNNIGTLY